MSKLILVVDDDTQTRTLISILLQRRGFRVIEAADAFEALDLLETHEPALIILDVMMPGMDGFELCQQVRQRPTTAATPIIIFSAMRDDMGEQRSFEVGADAFLSKVSLHHELLMQIRSLLGISMTDMS
jgi:CheY-like chemotaxis protein